MEYVNLQISNLNMLNKKLIRILAIHPGTREMGVAVLEGNKLVYFGVKSLRQGKLPERVLRYGIRIIERLIDEYEPQTLALEKTGYANSKRSSVLHTFCKKIKETTKKRGIDIFEYPSLLARKIICNNGVSTKRETAKVLTSFYSELKKYLKEPIRFNEKQKERYWMNVFDAVALALACYKKDVDRKL